MSRLTKKESQKKMVIVAFMIIAFAFVILIGTNIYFLYIYTPDNILRVARDKRELTEKQYILCQVYRTRVSDWRLIKDEHGEIISTLTLVNISGINPFMELPFSYEFEMGRNTFIFYIEKRTEVYSENPGEDTVEYVVTGWDILYPVRRVPFTVINPRRYIIEADLRKN